MVYIRQADLELVEIVNGLVDIGGGDERVVDSIERTMRLNSFSSARQKSFLGPVQPTPNGYGKPLLWINKSSSQHRVRTMAKLKLRSSLIGFFRPVSPAVSLGDRPYHERWRRNKS